MAFPGVVEPGSVVADQLVELVIGRLSDSNLNRVETVVGAFLNANRIQARCVALEKQARDIVVGIFAV